MLSSVHTIVQFILYSIPNFSMQAPRGYLQESKHKRSLHCMSGKRRCSKFHKAFPVYILRKCNKNASEEHRRKLVCLHSISFSLPPGKCNGLLIFCKLQYTCTSLCILLTPALLFIRTCSTMKSEFQQLWKSCFLIP